MDLRWKGVTYLPGVVIPEDLYEDFIDRSYGVGYNLMVTRLWNDRYERGFVSPDGDGGWFAFAYDGRRYRYLGWFTSDEILEEEIDWYDYEYMMEMNADVATPDNAIAILRELYLNENSKSKWTDKGLRIANDTDCLDWFSEYWSFVRWNEHGNQDNISDIGFTGFIDIILDPEGVSEYLLMSECDRGTELEARLSMLHTRYLGKGGRR